MHNLLFSVFVALPVVMCKADSHYSHVFQGSGEEGKAIDGGTGRLQRVVLCTLLQ